MSSAVRTVAALAGAMALWSSFGSTPAFAAAPTLTITPATVALQPGSKTDVSVVLTSDVPTRGIQFGLKFDPKVVSVDKVSDGTFYQAWASSQGLRASTMLPFKADNSKGAVSVGATVILGGQAGHGATGSAPVLVVTLSAPAGSSGQTTLDLVNVVVSDSAANPSNIPGVSVIGCAVGVGVDASTLQAPSAAGATSVQAPPAPVFGIGANGIGSTTNAGPGLANSQPQPQTTNASDAQPPAALAAQPTAAPPTTVPAPIQQSAPAPNDAAVQPESAVGDGVSAGANATTSTQSATQPATPADTPQLADHDESNPAPANQVQPGSGFTPGGQVVGNPAVPVPSPVPAQLQLQAIATPNIRGVATPTRAAVAAGTVVVPRSSSGLVIPWEVLAGIGGGVISAGLALYAVRGRQRGPLP